MLGGNQYHIKYNYYGINCNNEIIILLKMIAYKNQSAIYYNYLEYLHSGRVYTNNLNINKSFYILVTSL